MKSDRGRNKPAASSGPVRTVVASNRRARHDYDILQTWEAGIVLVGSEVKSLRDAHVQLKDSYARIRNGEVWLLGAHISPYAFSRHGGHDPERPRKLLLKRSEIEDMDRRMSESGLTVVPLEVAFVGGLVKVVLGLGRGKKFYDKRQDAAKRDAQREMDRAMSASRRRR